MKRDANEIFSFLKTFVLELTDTEEHLITPQANLQDLTLDSLDFVELQVQVKQTYGALIDPDSFVSGRIATLGQLVELIAAGGDAAANNPAGAMASVAGGGV